MPTEEERIAKVMHEMLADYPNLAAEVMARRAEGLPNLALTPEELLLPKKQQTERQKKLEKAATSKLQMAMALAVEGDDTKLAKDLLEHFTKEEDGVPAPDDKFRDLLITAAQLVASVRPLRLLVQLYRFDGWVARTEISQTKSFTELATLVLGKASGRLT